MSASEIQVIPLGDTLPDDTPAEHRMQALVRVYALCHTKAEELIDGLSRIDATLPEWEKQWDNAMTLNAQAVEAQMQLTQEMADARVAHVNAGEWDAYFHPASDGRRYVVAQIERRVA